MRGRRAAGALFLLGCIALAGCKVDTTVTIDVESDGSGVVTVDVALDADAVVEAEAGGATLESRVRLADLAASGWTVGEWDRRDNGGARLQLSKPFGKASDLEGVIAELSGPNGPLPGVSLAREQGPLRVEYRLRGDADLTQLSTGLAEDPELVANLTAQQVDIAGIDQRLLAELTEAYSLEVVVALPGADKTVTVAPGESASLDTTSHRFEPSRSTLLFGAALAAIVAVVVVVVGRRADRRRSRRRGRGTRAAT